MTTIAVRDGVIACDSMVVISTEAGGDRAYYNCEKIYPIEDEYIGVSGETDGALLWMEWYMGGCEDEDIAKRMGEHDFDIVILHSDLRIETSGASGTFEVFDEPFYAIGSGTKCALAAMHCGKSAAEAVEIAKLIDPHTGGKVQIYRYG